MAKFPSPPTRTPFLRQGASNTARSMTGESMSRVNKQQTIWLDAVKDRFDASAHIVAVPASANAPGTQNEMAISDDGNTLYICVAHNSWRKVTLATF